MTRVHHLPSLPPRPSDGHKGLFGRILIVGGNPEMLGAPVLAGTAAYRTGAGWVQIAVDKTLLPAALSITPELVGLALDSTLASLKHLLAAASLADALVIGPGMGVSSLSRKRLLALLKLKKPTLIDADAINLLAAEKKLPTLPEVCILTPHPGEMARLGRHFARTQIVTGDRARSELALTAALATGATIILKGARTVVASPPADSSRFFINPLSTSALSKAGTGDVLAGIVATLLAQLRDPFAAATLGVSLHARAGLRAGQSLGNRSVLARDVILATAQILKEDDA